MTPPAAAAAPVRRAIAAILSSPTPDPRAFGLLIQHCSDRLLFLPGRQLHARLVLFSITPSNFLASKLLTFYSRCNQLPLARRLFDAIPSKNLFSWNAMLLAYSLHHRPSDALLLFSAFPRSLAPDAFTISALLNSGSADTCRPTHALALRRNLIADIFILNGLITLYSKTEDLVSARKVFDGMPVRDIISWNSIISGYSHAGQYASCLRLYTEMTQGNNVRPNGVTVACVLQACSQLKDLVFGMGVHRFAVDNGVEMDAVVWNSVIGFYAKCGSLEYARGLFEEMEETDGVSYSAMISGYMSYGFVDRAMELFGKMQEPVLSVWNAVIAGLVQNNRFGDVLELFREMQGYGLEPNSVTISSILPAVAFFSNLLGGKQIHGYAIRNECHQNVYVVTALIDTYAKAGFVDGARRVFDGTGFRSVIVWTAIISGYAAHGDADAAISLFGRMLESGTEPDAVTFTAVLSACAHGGVVDEARRIFDTVMPKYVLSPAVEHYACMVGVLSRCGMLKEAVELTRSMPVEPNAKVWGALLNGAVVCGDVELGRFVFDRLFDMEPENTGNYILMANLYSRAGRWKEAEMVRGKMRGVGLGKIPGCSWLEKSDGLQVFVARDTVNVLSEEIYTVLEGLIGSMREEGYVYRDDLDEESGLVIANN